MKQLESTLNITARFTGGRGVGDQEAVYSSGNDNGSSGDDWKTTYKYFNAARISDSFGRRNEVSPINYAVYYYIKY